MNPERLTSIFRQNGHLGAAVVVEVETTRLATNGIGSEFFTAELRYSSSDHRLPERMVVKRPLVGDRGRGEADVYELILAEQPGLPVLRCFGILDEGPAEPLSLLFEDLSESHYQTTWPIVPALSDCERAVGALARIHGHWWARTGSIDIASPPVAAYQDPEHLATFFPDFADCVGDYLSPARIAHYEAVFTNLNDLLARRVTADNRTLLHTDPHFWNFLFPKDTRQGDCVIFDWPLWRTGLAGWDLAYMIGLHLYPEHRHRFEQPLLDHYWRMLQDGGVAYDRQDVQLDYRIGVIAGLLMPVMEFSWKIPPLDWMPKLEKAFAAFDELNCRELLSSV